MNNINLSDSNKTKKNMVKNSWANSNNIFAKSQNPIGNIKATDFEPFKVLTTLYLISDFNMPHLEFEQTQKGFFANDLLPNIKLQINNYTVSGRSGCIMDIIDTINNKKIMSKFLKSVTTIPETLQSVQDNLKLDYFQPENISSTIIEDSFYLSAKFKIQGKSFFEFKFNFYENKIILIQPGFRKLSPEEAYKESDTRIGLDFDMEYSDLYKAELSFG